MCFAISTPFVSTTTTIFFPPMHNHSGCTPHSKQPTRCLRVQLCLMFVVLQYISTSVCSFFLRPQLQQHFSLDSKNHCTFSQLGLRYSQCLRVSPSHLRVRLSPPCVVFILTFGPVKKHQVVTLLCWQRLVLFNLTTVERVGSFGVKTARIPIGFKILNHMY